MNKKAQGFTIVELLIVIVIIAILAATTIVAYNGIQNRANDSALQSDLSSMAKKIQLLAAEDGQYLAGTSATVGVPNTDFPGFTYRVSKGAYATEVNNLYYCSGIIDGRPVFRFEARSKSRNVFRHDSTTGLVNRGNVASSADGTCAGMTSPTYSYGNVGGSGGGTWSSWTN